MWTTGSTSKPLPGCSDTMGLGECHAGAPGMALLMPGNMSAVPQPCCQPPAKLLPCVSPALKCQPNLCFSPTINPRDRLISAQPDANGPEERFYIIYIFISYSLYPAPPRQDQFCARGEHSVGTEGMAALNRCHHEPPER